jgi:ferritin-like metal-binding protein YciE
MLLFAGAQPDTPGKLTAHAFSYEHMEVAAYELLRRVAERAGDEETARMASEIADEERRMAGRLADSFDAAVAASLEGSGAEDLDAKLDRYLADAHAIERQAEVLLGAAPGLIADEQLERLMRQHLAETEEHDRLVEERLEARGASPSKPKDAALAAGGFNVGGFFGGQPDTTVKVAGFAYAFEHLEIAAYELLRRVAERAGDAEAVALAERILPEERAAAEKLAQSWDRVSVTV